MTKEIWVGQSFLYILFHQKTVPKILDPSHLAILIVPPHHGSSRRPGTAPNSVNMGPKAPIIAYVVHLHHPRAQWPPIDAVMVRTEYYCDRNTRFVNFDRKILVASFFHHGDRAPQWRAWGAHLRAQYRPTGAQIRIALRRCMYRTTVWRKELIKQFLRYEIMIVLGDVPQNQV